MKKTIFVLFLLVVAGITLIALILRVWAVRKLPLDHDEKMYVQASTLYAQAIQQKNWPDLARIDFNKEHPSFTKLVYGLVLSQQKLVTIQDSDMRTLLILSKGIVKDMVMTVRNVSMVFGVLTVVLLAAFNPIAGLFLAVHSFAIKYTSVAYLEAIPSFTSLLAALAYLRWITLVDRQPNPLEFKNNLSVHLWLTLSGWAFGITIASKFAYGLIGAAIVVHFIWKIIWKHYPLGKATLYLAGYGALALIVFFVCDIYLWYDPVNRLLQPILYHFRYQDRSSVKNKYPVWQIFYWLSKSVAQHNDPIAIPHSGNDIPLGLDLPISILAIIGLPRLFKKNLLFFLWLVFSLAFLLVWQTRWPQYTMLILNPLCVSASEGFYLIVMDPLMRLVNRRKLKNISLPPEHLR